MKKKLRKVKVRKKPQSGSKTVKVEKKNEPVVMSVWWLVEALLSSPELCATPLLCHGLRVNAHRAVHIDLLTFFFCSHGLPHRHRPGVVLTCGVVVFVAVAVVSWVCRCRRVLVVVIVVGVVLVVAG